MSTRVVQTIPIVAIAVTPLCLLNGVFLSHDVMPKVILICLCAAGLLFTTSSWAGGLKLIALDFRGRCFLALVAAQVLSLSAATAFSTQPALSLAGTVWRRFGMAEQIAALVVAMAATAIAATDSTWVRTLLRAISTGGGLASLYGIAQFFGVDPFLDPALYRINAFGGIVRPPATMGHAIYFSAWLAPVAVLAASAARHETSAAWKRLHGAVAIAACAAILLSGSRGAVIGLAAGMILLIARSGRAFAFGRRIALAAAGLAVTAGIFTALPAGENLRHRMYQWVQDPGGPRTRLWRESPAILWAHPLLGAGPETFAAEFRRIESAELSRAYPDFYNETPHNVFLDAATAQGFPGLLILIGVFAIGWTGRARPVSEAAGMEAALLAILVCSLFASFSLTEWIYLWALAGISTSITPPISRKETVRSALRAPAWVSVPATLIGGGMLALALLLALPDFADAGLARAVSRKEPASAFQEFERAEAWSAGLPGNQLWRSREMATLGRTLGDSPQGRAAWKKAIEAAVSAEMHSEERWSAELQLSVLAIASGDLTKAELKARRTITMAPNWYKPHLLLGQLLVAIQRADEGVKEEQIAAALNPAKN